MKAQKEIDFNIKEKKEKHKKELEEKIKTFRNDLENYDNKTQEELKNLIDSNEKDLIKNLEEFNGYKYEIEKNREKNKEHTPK